MSLRQRVTTVLIAVWFVGAVVIYFRQFAAPVLRLLARSKGLP